MQRFRVGKGGGWVENVACRLAGLVRWELELRMKRISALLEGAAGLGKELSGFYLGLGQFVSRKLEV